MAPDRSCFREAATDLQRLAGQRPLIRALNFHNTPRTRADEYDRQLKHCSEVFDSVSEDDLTQYLLSGYWPKRKPGLIVALYNGYRNNYDVLLPLLERYGFIGWFFVVTGFVAAAARHQADFSTRSRLHIIAGEYRDERYGLNWNELKELELRKHVVASHTRNHSELATQDPTLLEDEIVGSQTDFALHLGHPVRSFASFSGAPFGADRAADRLLQTAGYQLVFSNLKIQRIPGAPPHSR